MAAGVRVRSWTVARSAQAGQSSPLLTVEDGIGVVAIEGPILRKPDLFARVLFGATGSEEIGDGPA